MNYIEIPNTGEAIGESVFLAGGITGCRDWRAEVVAQLMDSNLTVPLNLYKLNQGQVCG